MKIYPPFPQLEAATLDILQVNLGRLCNQSCRHCHFAAGPEQTDPGMSWEVQEAVLALLENNPFQILDLTGGSPELNPTFRKFVSRAVELAPQIKVRTNLTVLTQPEQADLPEFFSDRGVELVASLPCYTRENVDSQRGDGVFEKSIAMLRRLNELGYGREGSDLPLTLAYNPGGAVLPGPQAELELDYRRELEQQYGLVFNHLLTITNMPIGRFGERLQATGEFESYMDLLVQNYNSATLSCVMCRSLLSVAPDGRLYDCDFNQSLDLPLSDSLPRTVKDFDYALLARRPITTGSHCYGCTAGAGSSCMGALAA